MQKTAAGLTEKLHNLKQLPGNIYDSETLAQANRLLEKDNADRSIARKMVTRKKSKPRRSTVGIRGSTDQGQTQKPVKKHQPCVL